MKILMFGWEFPPFFTGGLGTHCFYLTKSLAEKNANITFVMPNSGAEANPNFLKLIQAGRLIKIGANLFPYLPSSEFGRKGNPKVYGMNFFGEIQNYTSAALHAVKGESCDVIHCHDWMTFPVGILAKEQKKKPLVVTVHSTEYDRTGSLLPNPWIVSIEREGLHTADRIITVSNYMKRQLVEKYAVPEGKIDVVYNAVNPREFEGEKLPFGIDKKIVLFLGRLTLQKGPDWFLYAAKKVLEKEKKVKFIVVGHGDMLPKLIDKSIELGINNDVIFTGFQEDIKPYYKIADLYVMTSVADPFGITALEAISAGIPTIISKQCGVSEVVRNCMAVDFWDVNELANKIIGVLKYNCLAEEMKSNASYEVRKFNWGEVADETLKVYQRAGT